MMQLILHQIFNAKAVAFLVFLDLKVLLVNLVAPVNPVHLVLPVPLVNPQQLHVNPLLHHHANHAHKDLPAHLDLPDPLVTQERLVPLADPDLMLLLVPLDLVDLLAQLENPDKLDPLVNLESPLNPNPLYLENPEKLEMLDHLAHPVHLEPPETMDPLDLLDQRVPLAQMEPQAQMVNPVPLVLLALLVAQEKKVFAPNTVLWTVVSSSKMELDDKRHIAISNIFNQSFAIFSPFLQIIFIFAPTFFIFKMPYSFLSQISPFIVFPFKMCNCCSLFSKRYLFFFLCNI